MRRRTFLISASSAAVAATGGRAQQPAKPVIGYLSGQAIDPQSRFQKAFHAGLDAQGFRDGRNITIEYRWADGDPGRLDSLAADLAQRRVDIIAATGGPLAAVAAKKATATIPIVFTSGLADPVRVGLVSSINRPGGNVTGVYFLIGELTAKRLSLFKELMPGMTRVAVLAYTGNSHATSVALSQIEDAAGKLSLKLRLVRAGLPKELPAIFDALSSEKPDGLFLVPDPFFTTLRADLVALADRHRIPVSYGNREYVDSGGLMSYGPDISASYRQVGDYVGRILKGDKAADLPVVQPTRYELVLNLKTAKELGIDIPDKVLALADEVIE